VPAIAHSVRDGEVIEEGVAGRVVVGANTGPVPLCCDGAQFVRDTAAEAYQGSGPTQPAGAPGWFDEFRVRDRASAAHPTIERSGNGIEGEEGVSTSAKSIVSRLWAGVIETVASRWPHNVHADDATDFSDAQHAAMALNDAIREGDRARFLALSADERGARLLARHALVTYVAALWEDAKAAGLNPALDPEWKGVAGMLDVSHELGGTVTFPLHEGLDDDE
jgi:hypothetical protein